MRKRSFEGLSLILPKVIKELGLEKGIKEQRAVELWRKVVGKTIGEKTKPLSITQGVLRIKVKDNIWKQELYFLKEELKEKLNRALGEDMVKNIKFSL